MTADEVEFARRFVESRFWKPAKTYEDTFPHRYTFRGWKRDRADQEDFERFVAIVRRCGEPRPFFKRTYVYLTFEGSDYWTMGAPIPSTIIINRTGAGEGGHAA